MTNPFKLNNPQTEQPSDFEEFISAMRPKDTCPFCNGTGQKRWGKLGVRACVKCKGSGKR